jgi:hypothetical protein
VQVDGGNDVLYQPRAFYSKPASAYAATTPSPR